MATAPLPRPSRRLSDRLWGAGTSLGIALIGILCSQFANQLASEPQIEGLGAVCGWFTGFFLSLAGVILSVLCLRSAGRVMSPPPARAIARFAGGAEFVVSAAALVFAVVSPFV